MIRVGFSNSKTIMSKIICWFTGSKVSHTFLILDNPKRVMEASWSGFRCIPLEEFERENTISHVVEPVVPLDEGVRSAENWLGEPYAYDLLIGMSWVLLGRWLRRSWRNPFNNPKSLMCSEAVAIVLQDSHYPGSAALDPASLSPADLLRFLQPNL